MLRLASFNIKNDYHTYNKTKSEEITKLLTEYDLDILSLQEVFSKCKKDISNILNNSKYQILGEYRYKLDIFKPINESTPIITKKEVIFNKTYHLPYLPSLLKRIVTKIIINDEKKPIVVLNTHLDYMFDFAKKRELKKILKIIKKETNSVILMGDFNLKNNKAIFNNFVIELEKLGLKRVPLNEKTLKSSKYKRAIDHIFIPKEYKIIDYQVKKDLIISDHYPIIVTIAN